MYGALCMQLKALRANRHSAFPQLDKETLQRDLHRMQPVKKVLVYEVSLPGWLDLI